jgi:ribosomal protein L37AE/L43A
MESLSKEIKCPKCNRPVTLKVDSEIINCNNCKRQYNINKWI